MLKYFFPNQGHELACYPVLSWSLENKPFIEQQQPQQLDKVAKVHEYEPLRYAPEAKAPRRKPVYESFKPIQPRVYTTEVIEPKQDPSLTYQGPTVKRIVTTVPIGKLTSIGFREADKSHILYLDGSKKYLDFDQQVVEIQIRTFESDEGVRYSLKVSIDKVPLYIYLKGNTPNYYGNRMGIPFSFMSHRYQVKPNAEGIPIIYEDGKPQVGDSIERYIYRLANPYHLPLKAGGQADRLRWVEETDPKLERILWNPKTRRYEFHEFEWTPADVFLDSPEDQDDPPDKSLRRTARLTDSERILFELDDIQSDLSDDKIAERYENISVRSSNPHLTPVRTEWKPILDEKGQVDKTGCILLTPHKVGGQILNDQHEADVAYMFRNLRTPAHFQPQQRQQLMDWIEEFLKDLNLVADGSDDVKQYYVNQLKDCQKLPKAQQLAAKRAIVAEVKRLAKGLTEVVSDAPEVGWSIDNVLLSIEPGEEYHDISHGVAQIVYLKQDQLKAQRAEALASIGASESYLDSLYTDDLDSIEDLVLPNRYAGNLRSIIVDEVRTHRAIIGQMRERIRVIDEALESLTQFPSDIETKLRHWYNGLYEDPETEMYDEGYEDDGFDVVDEETGIVHYSSQPRFDGITAAAFYGYRPIESNQVSEHPITGSDLIHQMFPDAKPYPRGKFNDL